MQDWNLKEGNCFENKTVRNLDCAATMLWELCRIWLSGYCSMRPSVEMIVSVLVWQHTKKLPLTCIFAKWVIIFRTPETAYVLCWRHWLNSVDLAFILWPKAEEWVMQRKGVTRFEKWKAVKVSTWVCEGFLGRGLKACVGEHGSAAWEWHVSVPCCCSHGHSRSRFRCSNKISDWD
jgi:hypothetical protein